MALFQVLRGTEYQPKSSRYAKEFREIVYSSKKLCLMRGAEVFARLRSAWAERAAAIRKITSEKLSNYS